MNVTTSRASALLTAVAIACLFAAPAFAEPTGPQAADQTLSPGFNSSQLSVSVGGARSADTFGAECKGYVSDEPTTTFDLTARGLPLLISVDAAADTTLVVRDPNGVYLCNDDGGLNLNPELFISEPVVGRYEIWVGSFASGEAAQASLFIAEARSAGPGSAESTTPPFPRWPPPRASARSELSRSLFADDENLGAVAARLMAALQASGNSRASFYTAPGGFVMVAQLERIRDDARPAAGAERFLSPRPGEAEKPNDPLGYVEALFFAPEGRYRQVMFVVTDRPVGAGGWTLTSNAATELLNEGSPDLIGPSRTVAFGPNYRVTALIYEFRKQGANQAAVSVPGRWNASTHLTRSGLMANLRR